MTMLTRKIRYRVTSMCTKIQDPWQVLSDLANVGTIAALVGGFALGNLGIHV